MLCFASIASFAFGFQTFMAVVGGNAFTIAIADKETVTIGVRSSLVMSIHWVLYYIKQVVDFVVATAFRMEH